MFERIGRYLFWLSALRELEKKNKDTEIVLLGIPKRTMRALLKQRLSPEDDVAQLFKDALGTHYQVTGAMRQGATVVAKKGDEFTPLDLSHIITPETRDALAAILSRARRI